MLFAFTSLDRDLAQRRGDGVRTHPIDAAISPGGNPPSQSDQLKCRDDLRVVRFPGLVSIALALLVACSAPVAFAANITAPAKNWVLPLFSKEGHRSMTARGSEARLVDDNHFEVVDLNLTLFSGDEVAQVDTILLSPAATFLPDQKIAHGEKSVRFIGDDIEASGTRWVYRRAEKKISLDGNVRVIFRAELKNLLQ